MKPVVVYTRPEAWTKLNSDVLDLVYCPPARVLRLRNGYLAGDSMGTVFTADAMKNLRYVIETRKPDIFLFWTHFGEFKPAALSKLRSISPRTVFVHGCGNQVLNKRGRDWYIERIMKLVDVQLTNTTEPSRIKKFSKCVPNVFTLHDSAFDPGAYKLSKREPEYDCFFGGGDSVCKKKPTGRFPESVNRHDFIMRLSERRSLLLCGGGKWKEHGIKYRLGHPNTFTYFRQMQRARIVVGYNHLLFRHYYTKRTVLGGASGRLLVTKYIPGMEKHFTNHRDIVWFKSNDEGLELIDHYLAARNELENIAARQRKRFEQLHSWEARLRRFEELVPVLMRCRRKKGKKK